MSVNQRSFWGKVKDQILGEWMLDGSKVIVVTVIIYLVFFFVLSLVTMKPE